MVEVRSQQVDALQTDRLEGSLLPVRRGLSEEARTIAGLVGPRSGFRGRALAVVMSALSMAQACMPPENSPEKDTNSEEKTEVAGQTTIEAMFTDRGVKLFGYAKEPMNFVVRLKGTDGGVVLEESHQVESGNYNLDIKCGEIATVDVLELVKEGKVFTFPNLQAGDMPEMPGR